MSTVIEATFDGEVFRPSQPVQLEPNTPVRLTIETAPPKTGKPYSFLDTLQSIKLEGPPDWSANIDKYLYGEELSASQATNFR
jgi:predicted DNA-binding antitoxin AbrB/MazE fold protein